MLLALSVALPGAARAQEAVAPRLKTPQISGYAEIVVLDRYIYHGYVADDHGPVIQPYLELLGEFYESGGFLTGAALRLAVFNSVQFYDQQRSSMRQPMRSWYEAQFEPGFVLTFAKDVTFTAKYVRFESPNGAFISQNAIELELELDDERWLGAFALHPRALWFAALAPEPENEQGHYFEVGITPAFNLGKESRFPVNISLPVTLGFGDKHYFAGRHFGFFSGGIALAVPLAFIPKEFGTWSLGASATYYRLGRTSAAFTNRGERNESVLSGTLSVEF